MFPPDTRVLVIDDSSTMRRIVMKGLMEAGLKNLSEAKNGKAGWEMIVMAHKSPTPFQLIVSDWNMPEMTGLELLKKVRSTAEVKAMPFVLLTAESEKAQVIEAISSGVDAYITKPFTAQNLTDKLTKLHISLLQKNKISA